MSVPSPPAVLPAVLLAFACGCQGLPTGGIAQRFKPPLAESSAASAVEVFLARETFRPNADWSPLTAHDAEQSGAFHARRFRWLYAGLPHDRLRRELHERGGAVNEQAPLDTAILEMLEEAAGRDDLVGWRAAVLRAQLHVADAEHARRHQHEVASRPRHDQRVAGRIGNPSCVPAHVSDAVARLASGDLPSRAIDPSPREATLVVRAAAAEVWCELLVHTADDPLDALAPAGSLLECPNLPDILRAELYLAVARHLPPAAIPGLGEALAAEQPANPRDPVRRAAMAACLVHALRHPVPPGSHAQSPWPDVLARWQRDPHRPLADPDPGFRQTFVLWLAAVRDPRTVEIAGSHLLDDHSAVRDGAIAALGLLGTAAARELLIAESRRTSGRARATVVRALARWGFDALAPFADDETWQVQQAVAEQLARFPHVSAAALLRNLATARPPQVQAAAVESTHDWPEALAVPVLLAALRDGTLPTRAAAFEALAARYDIDAASPHVEPDAGRRHAAVAEIAHRWNLPADFDLTRHAPPDGLPPAPADDALIEAALAGLDDRDVFQRRRAAQRLADLGRARSLGTPALLRLADRLVREPDVEVWRFSVEAVLPDATIDSARIAALAAGHPAPDLRVLACRYAHRHRQPGFAEWLRPLFDDPSRRVQVAAIEAAGRCGNADAVHDRFDASGPGSRGLRSLLTDANRQVRVAAAVAMCHLGEAEGLEAVLRLSHSPEPAVRQEIASAMGHSGERRFVPRLEEMHRTEPNDAVRRTIRQSVDQLTDL